MQINISNKRLKELASMSGEGCGCLSDAIKESAEMARFILALHDAGLAVYGPNGNPTNHPEFPESR
ncbi:hypothetical protein ACLEDY_05700 [Lonsdalea quercina]|uniref:hypothetical protein n=1 Tax=Lonsdalea quercina TaxID=71657 RepID=UPI003975FB79